MSSPYAVCEYVGRKGYCGKRCFGGRCNTHRKRETLALCLEDCGRGTASVTGYCHQCGYKQMTELKRRKRVAHRLEAYIEEVLSWPWNWTAPQCPTEPATLPTAECAASG